MTRFLLSLEQAAEVIFEAMRTGRSGETYVPRISAARVWDIARVLIGERDIEIQETGVRPGEKTHEILVSLEEASRTFSRGDYYVISPSIPELGEQQGEPALQAAYSSTDNLLSFESLRAMLDEHGLSTESRPTELLR